MDHRDIQVLKTYGAAPYGAELKKLEKEIKDKQQTINEKIGRLWQPAADLSLTISRRQGRFDYIYNILLLSLTFHRNQTPVSHPHISGILLPTDNECKKNSLSRSPDAQR